MKDQSITPPPIAHRESGDGVPVILLHGSASTSAQWTSMTGCLEGRFRVIAPDLPGYGRSPALTGEDATLADIADALVPLVAAQGQPVHLVGHSFGAAVALKLAARNPGRVRSLTMIEPPAGGAYWTAHGKDAAATRAFRAAAHNCITAAREGDAWAAMRFLIDFWNGAGAWDRTSPDLQQKMAATLGQVCRDFQALDRDRMDAIELAGVACPARIIRGSDSPAVMRHLATCIVDALPFCADTVIAGAGHMVPLTDPHIVDPMVGDFLVKVDRGWQDIAAFVPEELAA